MALITCKECGAGVNSKAETCPKCGAVIAGWLMGYIIDISKLLFYVVALATVFIFYLSSCTEKEKPKMQYERNTTELPTSPPLSKDSAYEPMAENINGNAILTKCADEGTTYDKTRCEEKHVGEVFGFKGTVSDVKSATTLKIKITAGNYAEVNFGSNIGDIVRKDQVLNFRGRLDFVGTGIVIAHKISDAILVSQNSAIETASGPGSGKRVLDVGTSLDQHGLIITVEKIEYMGDETRVYITVENVTGDNANFYSFQAKAVQGSTQSNAKAFTDYPKVHSELLPGVSSSGVVVFGRLDREKDLKLVFEGWSENYNLKFVPYQFDIGPGCYKGCADALPKEYISLVQGLIDAAKANDPEAIAERVAYPLKLEHPIPAIQNTQEMITRFDQVFDSQLLEIIANSKAEADWQTVGWRGIMLGRGVVWMDFDGKIIGTNYQTPAGAKLKAELIVEQQTALHASVSEFVGPELSWQTAKSTIRVDNMGNGQYRYAAWAKGKSLSEKPDLVLNKGKLVSYGTGGNHSFQFISGPYQYHCNVIILGTSDSPPGELVVYKNDHEIIKQAVIKTE